MNSVTKAKPQPIVRNKLSFHLKNFEKNQTFANLQKITKRPFPVNSEPMHISILFFSIIKHY